METKEQYMVTPVMNLAETVKMINKMKVNVESNISLVNQLQANIVTLQKSTARGLVVHNGKVLVRVDRKAREGDYVVFENANGIYTRDNKFYEVLCERNGEVFYEENGIDGYLIYTWDSRQNPKVYEVIGNLPQSNLVVEAFEPIPIENGTKPPCKHLTANQKRARVIAMAKEFVEDQKSCGLYNLKKSGTVYHCYAEFIRKNNRITCLLKGSIFSNIYSVGRAECHVDDVFNEHIGQAVALAKALDIVEQLPPDILKAVQPDSFVKGMKVGRADGEGHDFEREVERVEGDVLHFTNSRWMWKDHLAIIDDTNADYTSLQGGEK